MKTQCDYQYSDLRHDRLLRLPEVLHLTGLSRSTIYLMAQRGTFPKPVKITGYASGWRFLEVQVWLKSRNQKPE
jgi:prophage regulatory protein